MDTVSVGQDVVEAQVSNRPQQCEEAEDEFDYDESYEDLLADLPHDAFSSTNSFERFLVGLGVTDYQSYYRNILVLLRIPVPAPGSA